MSIWTLITDAREQEKTCAALGVELLQKYGRPGDYFNRAALHRAQYHEYMDTAQILVSAIDSSNQAS